MWLVFTHKSSAKSSLVTVLRSPPEKWQQGIRYEVFIHLDLLEDYMTASYDLQGAVNNSEKFTPMRRPYAWRYSIVDGALVEGRSAFLARLPLPPSEPESDKRPRQRSHDMRDSDHRREAKGGRDHEADDRHRDGSNR